MFRIFIFFAVAMGLISFDAEISFADDGQLDSAVEEHLKELGRPWPADCSLWSDIVWKKRKCVVAAYALAEEDSLRSVASVSQIRDQFRSLDDSEQQLYAPVLSGIAFGILTDENTAVELWRESYQLILSAIEAQYCDLDQLRKWERRVQIEGIVILTRAGFSDADPDECAQWQDQAHRMAVLIDCLAMIPLDEEENIDHNPKIIHWVKPKYPEKARRDGLEGTVIIGVLVNECGEVIQTTLQTAVHPTLNDLSLEAAAECRFSPGRRKGIPVKAWMELPYQFRLK